MYADEHIEADAFRDRHWDRMIAEPVDHRLPTSVANGRAGGGVGHPGAPGTHVPNSTTQDPVELPQATPNGDFFVAAAGIRPSFPALAVRVVPPLNSPVAARLLGQAGRSSRPPSACPWECGDAIALVRHITGSCPWLLSPRSSCPQPPAPPFLGALPCGHLVTACSSPAAFWRSG